MTSISRRNLITSASALALAGNSLAQTPPIAGPIRILVGFPAGGTIDVVARALAEKMAEDLGVPVVVDSRPGAGGQIAAAALKQAAPDGKTLMLGADHTMVVIPLTMKAPGFDPLKDFVPVGQVTRYLGALAVSASTGVKDLPGFIAWARANPAQATIGVPAPGSIPQFAVDAMGKQYKVPLQAAPYRGSAPLVQDLAGGQVAAGMTALGDFLEFHKTGRIRIIAVMDDKRTPLLPDVGTFGEQGFPLTWNFWLGLTAPAGTPQPIVDRLNASIAKALAQKDLRDRMAGIVFEPVGGSPAALNDLVRAGMRQWDPVIKASGWVAQ